MVNPSIRQLIFLLSILGVLLPPVAEAAGKLSVYTVNYPLAYFTQRIGGEHVAVSFPAPKSVDPAYWIPDIATISGYQQADLIVLNGASYAQWVDKVSLPRSKVVNSTKAVKDRYISIKGAVTHSHGAEGEHAHEGVAFTTWLDFDLAARQAEAICHALIRKRSDKEKTFKAACARLVAELETLDKELQSIVAASTHTVPLLMSHPVYDYLAARYGLGTHNLHWEPDQIPTAEQIGALKVVLKTHPAKWLIWEDTPEKASVEKLEALGIQSLVFAPCGNVPQTGDFMSVMRQNIDSLKRAF